MQCMPKEDSSDSFKFAQEVEFDVWHLFNNPHSQNMQYSLFLLATFCSEDKKNK